MVVAIDCNADRFRLRKRFSRGTGNCYLVAGHCDVSGLSKSQRCTVIGLCRTLGLAVVEDEMHLGRLKEILVESENKLIVGDTFYCLCACSRCSRPSFCEMCTGGIAPPAVEMTVSCIVAIYHYFHEFRLRHLLRICRSLALSHHIEFVKRCGKVDVICTSDSH